MKHLRILILIPLTLLLTGSVTQQHLMVVARKNVAGGAPSGTSPGTTGLIEWWDLDETSGNRVGEHAATVASDTNTVLYTTGVVGNSALFDETNAERLAISNASTPAGMDGGDVDFMITCWVQFDTDPANNPGVVGKGDGSGNYQYALRKTETDDKLYWYISNNGTALASVSSDTFGAVTTGVWYFVVVYHNATSDTIGISVGTSAPGTFDTTAHTTGIFDGAQDFSIGRVFNTQEMDGKIDEINFWSRILTSDELTWLCNGGSGRAYADL